jgi:dynein heavy chain
MKDIDVRLFNVIGDVLISAGSVCYLGPFTAQFRSDLVQDWREKCVQQKIPHSANVSIQVLFFLFF